MEQTIQTLIPRLREVAGGQQIISQAELADTLGSYDAHDLESLLDKLVEAGLLRRMESYSGQTYYWLARLDSSDADGAA